MKYWTALILALAPLPALAEPATIPLDARHTVALDVPAGWRLALSKAEPGVSVRSGELRGEQGLIKLLFMVPKPGSPLMQAADKDVYLGTLVEKAGQAYVDDSVEGRVNLQTLDGPAVHGKYACFTDKSYDPAKAQPDSYKYISSGVFLGGSVLAVVTTMGNGIDKPACQGGLDIVSTLREVATPGVLSVSLNPAQKRYELSLPSSRLALAIPQGGLQPDDFSAAGGGTASPRYFVLTDKAGLIISGWFEPAKSFAGTQELWQQNVAQLSRSGLPPAEDVVFDKVGDWETVVYNLSLPGGSSISSANMRAQLVRAGTWIELHISVTSSRPAAETRAQMLALLKTIGVSER